MEKIQLAPSFSLMAMGKTAVSKDAGDFKLYIGLGSSRILALNPNKAQEDELMGFESANDPVYYGTDVNGNFARVTFIVRTVPERCNGIEITNRLSFKITDALAYSSDNSKVQVIDKYGNSAWTLVDNAKAGKKIFNANGTAAKIDEKYRVAYRGEADLINFLKIYLGIEDPFKYVENYGYSIRTDVNFADYECNFNNVKALIKGDFREVQDAFALQPNNKVKLLYGVRTNPETGRKYQTIATGIDMILRHNATYKAVDKLSKKIRDNKKYAEEHDKINSPFLTTKYSFDDENCTIGTIAEYKIEPTNLEIPVENTQDPSNDLPFDSWND